jgi:hypothetical protein
MQSLRSDNLQFGFLMNVVNRWRLSLLLSLGVVTGGTLLIVVLAFGAADPPRSGVLVWQANSDEHWQTKYAEDSSTFYQAPVSISSLPFTLELAAENKGSPDSAWGLWLETEPDLWLVLVSREGYFAAGSTHGDQGRYSLSNSILDWREFLHIRPRTKIYLHVDAGSSATLRLNDEVAWTGTLTFSSEISWGIIHYKLPKLNWQQIQLYGVSP